MGHVTGVTPVMLLLTGLIRTCFAIVSKGLLCIMEYLTWCATYINYVIIMVSLNERSGAPYD